MLSSGLFCCATKRSDPDLRYSLGAWYRLTEGDNEVSSHTARRGLLIKGLCGWVNFWSWCYSSYPVQWWWGRLWQGPVLNDPLPATESWWDGLCVWQGTPASCLKSHTRPYTGRTRQWGSSLPVVDKSSEPMSPARCPLFWWLPCDRGGDTGECCNHV